MQPSNIFPARFFVLPILLSENYFRQLLPSLEVLWKTCQCFLLVGPTSMFPDLVRTTETPRQQKGEWGIPSNSPLIPFYVRAPTGTSLIYHWFSPIKNREDRWEYWEESYAVTIALRVESKVSEAARMSMAWSRSNSRVAALSSVGRTSDKPSVQSPRRKVESEEMNWWLIRTCSALSLASASNKPTVLP